MSTKKDLIAICKTLGINQNLQNKTKDVIKVIIKDFELKNNTKIINSGKVIKRIYHTADIHIRPLDRHTEYSEVFNNLYETLKTKKDLNESVFVICGDIFHKKDHLISECILLFNKFIENLTKIIDVIMILGNHDTFSHNDRLDTISGITDIKVFSNFYFLKYSGVYKYHNIDFHVSSLLDNTFLRCPLKTCIDDTIRVSLYHGPVTGCKLDNGMEYNSETSIKLSDFKGYDYVLLGDIHKKQYLADHIAYPGSLIQQNHKESNEHGILDWDLTTKNSLFIPILNNYGYRTIKLVDKKLIGLDDLPKYSYIKFFHDYLEEYDINDIKKQISEHTEIKSFTKEILVIDNKSDTTLITSETGKDIIHIDRDTYALSIFNNLISGYTPEIQTDLLKIHNSTLNGYQLDKKENSSNSWRIKNVEFMNMFIYGNDHINTINFETMSGIVGILATNAAGKSSIIHIILYCLFGNKVFTSKNYSNRNIINKNSKTFYVKMVINIIGSDVDYIIERKGKNKKRTTKGVVSWGMEEVVTFSVINDTETNLTDSTKIDTIEKMHNLLNLTTKDSFILTNVLSYSNYVSLLNMTNSEISTKISELFDLSKYAEMYSGILKIYREITTDIKTKDALLLQLNETKSDITLEVINVIESDLTLLQMESVSIETEIQEIIEKEISIGKTDNIDIRNFKGEDLEAIKSHLNTIKMMCEEYDDIIVSMTQEYTEKEISKKITEYKSYINKNKHLKFDDNNSDNNYNIDDLTKQLNELNIKRLDLSEKNVISESEYTHIQNKESFSSQIFIDDLKSYNDMSHYSSEIVIPKDLYYDLLDYLKVLNSKVYLEDTLKVYEYNNYQSNLTFNKNIEKEENIIRVKLSNSYKKKIIEFESCNRYNGLKSELLEIQNYLKYKEIIEMKNKLGDDKRVLKNKLSKINKSIYTLNKKLIESKYQLDQQNKSDLKREKLKLDLKKLKSDEMLYKIYKTLINDKSLPKMILTETIKKIEIEANNLIYKLTGLYMIMNSEEGNWEILIKKDNMILGVEHLSGYQRFIVNVCLKLTLDKYKFFDKAQFFCIDETIDAVSSDNIDKVSDLFDILRKEYTNILVISHNEEFKLMVDHRINIKTDFICSEIA